MNNKKHRRSRLRSRLLKAFTAAVASLLMLLTFTAAIPASAAIIYSLPSSATLLYTMDFTKKEGWSPKKSERSGGTLSLKTDSEDNYSAYINATANQKCNNWGGEIEGLPLNDYTAYTVLFTLTRSTQLSEKDPNIAVYLDGYYGFYAYSTNLRLLDDMQTLSGHATYTFSDVDDTISGNSFASTGESVQYYAMEINGTSKTYRVFLRRDDYKYVLIDGSKAGEIKEFHTDNLGLWFHQYNTEMTIMISDFTVWEGNLLTREKTDKAPESTKASETQAEPDETLPAEDTAPAVDTAVTPAETTSAPETEAAKSGIFGCSSSAAFPAAVLLPCSLLMFYRRRKRR